MKGQGQNYGFAGLKNLRTGAPKHCTPPTPNSKTQKRKRALQSYTPQERFGGRNP